MSQIPYKNEVKRKLFHLFAIFIPLFYIHLSKEEALLLLLPITVIIVFVDIGRHFIPAINAPYQLLFGQMLRDEERVKRYPFHSGATPLILSSLLCVAIFPKIIAITAISILAISDTAAALVGRKWGRTPFMGKTVEGTLAFIVSSILIIYIVKVFIQAPLPFLIIGIVASIVGGLAEALSKYSGIDDNFTVALSVGFTLWGLESLL